MRTFAKTNAVGLSAIAFASYFDVYSHAHIFVGTDPWWNPAHLLLYCGFGVILYGAILDRPRGFTGYLGLAGIVTSATAAGFNEVWHRVLLFGDPIPEPFPVEPPHALLAVGIILIGSAALLHPLNDASVTSTRPGKIAVAFTAGSLWLVVAGSAFYVGGAYGSDAAYLFAVGTGSFAASLFIAYSSLINARFGYSTLSYLWFMGVYFIFFIPTSDWVPLGAILVALLDYAVVRRKILGIGTRLPALAAIAVLYGLIYYPILPTQYSLAINVGLVASAAGVVMEYALEKVLVPLLMKSGSGGGHPLRVS